MPATIGHLLEAFKRWWLPIDSMTVPGDSSYFTNNPQHHMYLHPEYPSYEAQLDARDNMLTKHPDLIFVGAHLGSLEWNVAELAKRLDRFPNMAVDIAARMNHLQIQDRSTVREFFINYEDRLLYGTDIGVGAHAYICPTTAVPNACPVISSSSMRAPIFTLTDFVSSPSL